MSDKSAKSKPHVNRSTWNHHPVLPIETAPYFKWPSKPGRIIKWLAATWLPIKERGMIIVLSILTWFYATPALERYKVFASHPIHVIYYQ